MSVIAHHNLALPFGSFFVRIRVFSSSRLGASASVLVDSHALTNRKLQAKPVAKKLALARRVSVSYFASSALLAECLVSYLSVKAVRAEGPVSYLSIAALRAQRNRSYIQKNGLFLMQPNEFDASARNFVPWRNFVTEVRRGHVLR